MKYDVDLDLFRRGSHNPSYFSLARSMRGSGRELVDFCVPCNPYFPTREMFATCRLVSLGFHNPRLPRPGTPQPTDASAGLLDGKPVVGFEVSRSRGESEVQVGAAVLKALEEVKAQRPDLQLTQAFDFVTPVQEEYEGSLHLLYEGAILAVIVVWLFLRDWRATLVAAAALLIPAGHGRTATA